MSLYIISLGLHDYKDISIKALELIKDCNILYLENYTCKYKESIEELEKKFNKEIIPADRTLVENNAETTILENAKTKHVGFLVIGDAMSATTHSDIFLRAKKLNIKTHVIPGSSVFTAIAITGLQLYNFGKTASIPFNTNSFKPETYYNILKENKNLHTLMLLDLKKNKFMTIKEAINNLLDIENKRKENVFTENTLCIGCARLGSLNPKIIAGSAKELKNEDFGEPVHCLIVPGKLHFKEEEMINIYRK